jgi:23S rRNA (adenine2503-C2)-methyltransferase
LKQNIFGMSLPELQVCLKEFKLPAYRAKQIAEWMYQKHVLDFQLMTNLPVALRTSLTDNLDIFRVKLLERQDSRDGKTSKFLLELADGIAVESVLMRQSYGNSVCLSTQAGCSMGCTFCASTLHGMVRNLTQGEILAQALYINELLNEEEQSINTIVIMGSGEPLVNYDNVLRFIRLCHEPYTMNLGYRHIAVSTAGIVPMIQELAKEDLPITLSISLHAPNNVIRSKLMPINDKFDINAVVAAGKHYVNITKRRVTYEYILIAGENDQIEHAEELSRLLRGQMANVNLIPINPVEERGLKRPSLNQIKAFEEILNNNHIAVTVRREMGNDIQAACGQLRNKHTAENQL